MKKVMVFGTFDVLHPGHLSLFEQAKQYGDYLIVVVARDSTVEEVKGKTQRNSQHERLSNVRNVSFVDKAVLGYEDDKSKIVLEEAPDVICFGYDQVNFVDKIESMVRNKELNAQIIRLRPHRPDKYKSSKMP